MAKKNLICLPFDENGEIIGYTKFKLTPEEAEECYETGSLTKTYMTQYYGCEPKYTTIEWRPATYSFTATLELQGKQRNGCSAKNAIWLDRATGKVYYMFFVDVLDLLRVDNGFHILTGKFMYVKRGENYGIKWVGESK